MERFAGIDVSLEPSSVRVVDATGRIVREAKKLSIGALSKQLPLRLME